MEFQIREPLDVVAKGWGGEVIIVNNNQYCGKLLEFHDKAKFSLHFHLEKDETFYVLRGSFTLRYKNLANGQDVYKQLDTGCVVDIPKGFPHQLLALSDGATIIEFSTPHKDEDSYRVEGGDSQK